MSLFRFFRPVDRVCHSQEQDETRNIADHMPTINETGLGVVEYDQVSAAVSELTDPSPAKKRRVRGSYTQYSVEQRALIGRYALENGNERARKHFHASFPNLKESTIRNLKKLYKEKLDHQRKQSQPKAVTSLPT